MHKVEILEDSLNLATGKRLTTFILTFPRYINAEVLRHRVFSFCSASSRAIPIKQMIEMVDENMVVPSYWGKNKAGMQATEEIDDNSKSLAERVWIEAAYDAIESVEALEALDVHKQISNRLLEPFQHITLLLSGTDFDNFFELRTHESAQPEFRDMALEMQKQYTENKPVGVIPMVSFNFENIKRKNIHAPFLGKCSDEKLVEHLKICVARCARLSYMTYGNEISIEKDLNLFERLKTMRHWSPFEHIAIAMDEMPQSSSPSNFGGNWLQLRKIFEKS